MATLLDRIKKIFTGKDDPQILTTFTQRHYFESYPVSDGFVFKLPLPEIEKLRNGEHLGAKTLQFSLLEMLAEEGLAEVTEDGFLLPTQTVGMLVDAERLDVDNVTHELYPYRGLTDILQLPKPYYGEYAAKIRSNSARENFHVELQAIMNGGSYPIHYISGSAELQLSRRDRFSIGCAEIEALEAWTRHKNLHESERTESENLRLLTYLHEAKNMGMPLDLGHLTNFTFKRPKKVGVSVTQHSQGDLSLMPNWGDTHDVDAIERRLHHLSGVKDEGVLRIDNDVVLFEGNALKAVRNIIENNRIPAHQATQFFKTPSAFLDGSIVDLDNGFSARVEGIGVLKRFDFGFDDSEKNDWFNVKGLTLSFGDIKGQIRDEESLTQVIDAIEKAQNEGLDTIHFNDHTYTIDNPEEIDTTINHIKAQLAQENAEAQSFEQGKSSTILEEYDTQQYGVIVKDVYEQNQALLQRAAEALGKSVDIHWREYKRSPYPHQKEGVEWIVGLLQQAIKENPDDLTRVRGALLADDMGLGKTYMSLIAMAEYYRMQKQRGAIEKPILVVAPLSLLENWEEEVAKTYHHSIFEDLVILQTHRDLNTFRIHGLAQESKQLKTLSSGDLINLESKIRYALKIGKEHGRARLDRDRRLVLTTYDTLRNYQLSLCSIDWGMVIFDEAQHIKNANSLQTQAAKALKSDFNLLVTGTPIENNLAEFWCLMDTAQPGLLGDYRYFKESWVDRLNAENDEDATSLRESVGRDLRSATGAFMLRRTKEDELENLPVKRIFSGTKSFIEGVEFLPSLSEEMVGEQLSLYDETLKHYHSSKNAPNNQHALATLWRLRQISLHPELVKSSNPHAILEKSRGQEDQYLEASGKLKALTSILNKIAEKQEKVIIFCITKSYQLFLKQWLEAISGLNIAIINGDTKAVSSGANTETRKSLIKAFEAVNGFNIIIMSPVAAGTGLTVVGANHVIHLERHWNPAKEAQATDRVYRIGQEKPVSVYLPTLTHPDKISFDEHLDGLLQRKMLIKDAVVVPEVVTETEFMKNFFN
ncbi:ATP-dependent helicase [Ignatzschineria ureiclastica]|uniref:ATP-dependent helicase n=1 Tax=Ignatzschineria ureiclastica TaxID=472582 RepID=A0A2U2ACQ4_9GAMM|nr:DEAD/DEAH box helicase [Ignatzschineria ureiclastica]PWD80433.1 ATP-dependent helicase [Ignatzschineria ureiclastica]GGZ99554.1 hypothetical protein GCM10007162_14640 [Ignatzschineria ureiclastica]